MEILDLVLLKGDFDRLSSREKEAIKDNAQLIWDDMRRSEIFKKAAGKIILKGNIYKTMDRGISGLSLKAKGAVKFYGEGNIGGKRKENKIMKVYDIEENEKILIAIDQSMLKNLKESIVVTDKFIYGKKEDKSIKKIPIDKVEKIYSNKYTVQINDEIILTLKEIPKEVRLYLEYVFCMFKHGICDMNEDNEISADYKKRFTGDLTLMANKMKERSMDRGSIN